MIRPFLYVTSTPVFVFSFIVANPIADALGTGAELAVVARFGVHETRAKNPKVIARPPVLRTRTNGRETRFGVDFIARSYQSLRLVRIVHGGRNFACDSSRKRARSDDG